MRKKNNSFCRTRLLPVLTAVVLAVSACTDLTRPMPGSLTDSDLTFAAGADRPPTPKTLYAMARILGKQGKEAEHRLILTKIIREHPDFPPGYNDLAELYLRRRSVDDAIRILQTGLAANPDSCPLINNLGICLLLKKDYARALASFAAAAALMPQSERYRSNMAVALALMGRDDEASALFMQVTPAKDARHNMHLLRKIRSAPPADPDGPGEPSFPPCAREEDN